MTLARPPRNRCHRVDEHFCLLRPPLRHFATDKLHSSAWFASLVAGVPCVGRLGSHCVGTRTPCCCARGPCGVRRATSTSTAVPGTRTMFDTRTRSSQCQMSGTVPIIRNSCGRRQLLANRERGKVYGPSPLAAGPGPLLGPQPVCGSPKRAWSYYRVARAVLRLGFARGERWSLGEASIHSFAWPSGTFQEKAQRTASS